MQLRRHKDIVAFKAGNNLPAVAFHSKNMELAEISEELWSAMPEARIDRAEFLAAENTNTELYSALENWNSEMNPDLEPISKSTNKIQNLTINVTQICNLQCTYCAAGGDGSYGSPMTKISVEKTLPQLKFFLDKLNSGESFHITFLGGEPLLYPEGIRLIADYVKLSTAGKDIHTSFSIVTNGTLLTEKNIALLASIQAGITVSIDGPPEVNDINRPMKNGAGSTDIVAEGIHNLLAAKESLAKIHLHAVFNHAQTDLVKAYDYLNQFDVDSIEFTYSVEKSDLESSAKFTEGMQEIAKKAFAKGGEKALRKIRVFDHYFKVLDEQHRTQNYCNAGKSYLMLDAQNRLYTCPWDVGNKDEQVGSGTSLDTAKLEKYAKPLIELNNCQTCWARHMCGGGCMFMHKTQTGSKNIKDNNFCIRTRTLISTALLYYKECRDAC